MSLVKIGTQYVEANDVCSINYYNPVQPRNPDARIITIRNELGNVILSIETNKDRVHELMDQYATAVNVQKKRMERMRSR